MPERPDSYDRRPWYKVYSREALEGSLRFDCNSEERGVWWDFCHMANESRTRGVIQANDETPYPHPWLAAKLNISLELLDRCIEKFTSQKRIYENEHGIEVLNFQYWQGLNTRKVRGRPRKYPLPTEEEKLESEYRTRIGVAYRGKKHQLGRDLTVEENQELQNTIHKEVYGDD